MDRRLKLHELLAGILGDESRVYFQPPENLYMQYPCIVYRRVSSHTNYGDDKPFFKMKRYEVTYIFDDPDDPEDVLEKLTDLRLSIFDRQFVVDDLYNATIILYF